MLVGQRTYVIRSSTSDIDGVVGYEVSDPGTGATIVVAMDEDSSLARSLLLSSRKGLLEVTVTILEADDSESIEVRHESLRSFRACVDLRTAGGRHVGRFANKVVWHTSGFCVVGLQDQVLAEVKSHGEGWKFSIIHPHDANFEVFAKKRDGLGRDLFDASDNYVLTQLSKVHSNSYELLMLAAGIAIDVVLKGRPN